MIVSASPCRIKVGALTHPISFEFQNRYLIMYEATVPYLSLTSLQTERSGETSMMPAVLNQLTRDRAGPLPIDLPITNTLPRSSPTPVKYLITTLVSCVILSADGDPSYMEQPSYSMAIIEYPEYLCMYFKNDEHDWMSSAFPWKQSRSLPLLPGRNKQGIYPFTLVLGCLGERAEEDSGQPKSYLFRTGSVLSSTEQDSATTLLAFWAFFNGFSPTVLFLM